jgi:hypothetical protein
MKSSAFCHITPCRQDFAEEHICNLIAIEEEAKQETSKTGEFSLPPVSAGFFLGLVFDAEDGAV